MKTNKNFIHLTPDGKKRIQNELKQRLKLRKEIAKKIEQTASFGDRSENASYSSALEERDLNEARIAELENILENCIVVREDKGNKDRVVSVGDRIVLSINGRKAEYKISGTGTADPTKNELSIDSPIGRAIHGKRVGDTVSVEAPLGKIKVKIEKIF
jgi:transcription elongation factor GreA|uniref:Transcription elongation factor GreA n=1 Tax=candidate division CPR3 bacterium TaxID=2268181 RepID=A0A7C5UTX3_UNCC3